MRRPLIFQLWLLHASAQLDAPFFDGLLLQLILVFCCSWAFSTRVARISSMACFCKTSRIFSLDLSEFDYLRIQLGTTFHNVDTFIWFLNGLTEFAFLEFEGFRSFTVPAVGPSDLYQAQCNHHFPGWELSLE